MYDLVGLGDGHGLPGKRGLVNPEVNCTDQSDVCRHDIAGLDIYDIARYDLPCRDLADCSVSQHTGCRRAHAPQGGNRLLRAILLDHADRRVECDDNDDRDGIDHMAQPSGDDCRCDQQHDHDVRELMGKQAQHTVSALPLDLVRADLLQLYAGVATAESGFRRCAERTQDHRRILAMP